MTVTNIEHRPYFELTFDTWQNITISLCPLWKMLFGQWKSFGNFYSKTWRKYVLFVFHSTIFRQIQWGAVISLSFIQNSHKIHPIARPWGWDLGCLLWGQTLIYVLTQLLQCCVQYMMTSSNGNIFHLTGLLCGEFTGHRWIPCTRASDAELWWVFFNLHLNKRLNKQSWGWRFETPLCP